MATLSSCWKNLMARGALQGTVPGVTKSQTQLKQLSKARQKGSGTSQEKFPPIQSFTRVSPSPFLKFLCMLFFAFFSFKNL